MEDKESPRTPQRARATFRCIKLRNHVLPFYPANLADSIPLHNTPHKVFAAKNKFKHIGGADTGGKKIF